MDGKAGVLGSGAGPAFAPALAGKEGWGWDLLAPPVLQKGLGVVVTC